MGRKRKEERHKKDYEEWLARMPAEHRTELPARILNKYK